ncbi:MAG: hypothetical protein GY874_07545 [Desulfobacteraceae bacterium]|nr:hypothetical protein [Desulfobacteraceae bacterium]
MKNIIKIVTVMLIFGFLATPMAFAEEQTISGTIAQSDQGIVLAADDGAIYLVAGQDLSSMVGKAVEATGTIEEGEAGKTLTISSVEEISGEQGDISSEEAMPEEGVLPPPSEKEGTAAPSE